MGLMTLPSSLGSFRFAASPDVPHFGPAGNYTPRIRAAFIRREENYGMCGGPGRYTMAKQHV